MLIRQVSHLRHAVAAMQEPNGQVLTACMQLQSAGMATTVALTSSAVFCTHCVLQQDRAASLHPPLMYACILALLLLPLDFAFKVRVWLLSLCTCPALAEQPLHLRCVAQQRPLLPNIPLLYAHMPLSRPAHAHTPPAP